MGGSSRLLLSCCSLLETGMIFESWYYCHKSVVEAVLWFNNITDRRVYPRIEIWCFCFQAYVQPAALSVYFCLPLFIHRLCLHSTRKLLHPTATLTCNTVDCFRTHRSCRSTRRYIRNRVTAPDIPTLPNPQSRLSVSSCTRYCLLSAVCSCLLPKTSTTTLHSCRHSIIISAHSVYANLWEESFNHSHCNVWN